MSPQPIAAFLTARHGKSGLGVEAKKADIQCLAEAEGIDLISEHVEVETGEGADSLERRLSLPPRSLPSRG